MKDRIKCPLAVGLMLALVLVGGCRTIDGSANNVATPDMGRAGTALVRAMGAVYEDGVGQPADVGLPNPRFVSNRIFTQRASVPNAAGVSNMVWQWGQFLDHDLSLSPTGGDRYDIEVPRCDPQFDSTCTGEAVIPLLRSEAAPGSGVSPSAPRSQMNAITAWIDASNVYGSDETRANALRTNDGTGRLKLTEDGLLPSNAEGLPNDGAGGPDLFLAGDVRANEQSGLTALHTLFVREHNRLAAELDALFPGVGGDAIYRAARALVGAEMQIITYNEFLPAVLGADALPAYGDYDETADASIDVLFSTAAYRFGHSMVSDSLRRLDAAGNTIPEGDLALAAAFFDPSHVRATGIESLLRGLAATPAQEVDTQVVDGLRNALFGPPTAGGMDLVSLNIQRGRDHGLPSYNEARTALGLEPAATFADVSSDPAVQADLAGTYGSPDDIDLWVGGLAEDHVPGALVGEVFWAILTDQFERLRKADRFWCERVFRGDIMQMLEETTLAEVIRRNTTIGDELADDVFRVPATPAG